MTVLRKIQLGYVLIAVLVLASTVVYAAMWALVDRPAQHDRATDRSLGAASAAVPIAVARYIDVVDQGLLSRGFTSGVPAQAQESAASAKQSLQQIGRIDDKGVAAQATTLATSFAAFTDAAAQAMRYGQEGDVQRAQVVALSKVDPLAEQVVTQTAALQSGVERLIAQREQHRTNIANALRAITVGLFLAAAGLSVILAVVVPRTLRRQIVPAIGDLSVASGSVQGIAAQVSSGAVETATAIGEAAATVDEVRQTSLLASQKSSALSDSAGEAEIVAESGRQAMTDIVGGMQDVQVQVGVVADSIVRLSEQTEAIAGLISTSNDLAEQSNLLAVNAAIEAAKATEHGKGFGVVAGEIKSLAQQSKDAVQQVRGILVDITQATTRAVDAAQESTVAIDRSASRVSSSRDAIESLADSVEMSAHASTQIAASSQQQLVGVDQIGDSMKAIDAASRQNAEAAMRMEADVDRLRAVAERLAKLMGTGDGGAAVAAQSATAGGAVAEGEAPPADDGDEGRRSRVGALVSRLRPSRKRTRAQADDAGGAAVQEQPEPSPAVADGPPIAPLDDDDSAPVAEAIAPEPGESI
jgi:methyl-accepting chemotaxis protein